MDTRGPNWIHGTENNPILGLARETNTVIHSWGEHQSMLDDSGQVLNDAEVSELQETFWEIVTNAFAFSKANQEAISRTDSLMDFFKQEALRKFANEPASVAHRKRDMLIQTADMWGAFVGSPVEKQSLKFFWLEECIEGENPFVAGTYSRILAKIAEPALNGALIRYEQEVTEIVNKEEAVEVTIAGHNPESFDEVIVTVPLGCLKAGEPAFSPPLPIRLQQAIKSIGYGCLDKVYITFPSAFWQGSDPGEPRTNNSDQLRMQNEAGTDLSGGRVDEAQSGFTFWLAPKYAASSNPEQWSQECVNLAGLPFPSAHPTLLFYVFGPCAQHIAHLVTNTPASKLDETLIAFFKPYISRLPNYKASNSNCTPLGVLATAWANDKFAGRGSYSNFQVGLEAGDKDIECMREGMAARHVWFAGEHTAPFVALGTVTGAYWAGEGVARRIVDKAATENSESQV